MSSDILLWHSPHEQSLILQNDMTYHTGAAKEYNHLLQSERLHQVLQLKITYPYAHICNYTSIPVKQLKKYYEPIFHKEEKFSDIQNSLGLASCLATKTDQFRGRCDPRDPNAGCGHTNKSLAHCSLCATAAALLRASLYMLSANQHANWGNNVSQRLHSCLPSVFRGLHPVFLSFLRKHSACSRHLLINNGLLYCSIQTRISRNFRKSRRKCNRQREIRAPMVKETTPREEEAERVTLQNTYFQEQSVPQTSGEWPRASSVSIQMTMLL